MFKKKETKAFTLVELLVVISIIAILLAILMPSLQKARNLSQRAVCRSNLKEMGLVILMYGNDNRYHFPDLKKQDAADPWTYPWEGNRLKAKIDKYFGNQYKVLYCPSNKYIKYEDWQANWRDPKLPTQRMMTWIMSFQGHPFTFREQKDQLRTHPLILDVSFYGWRGLNNQLGYYADHPGSNGYSEGGNYWFPDQHTEWINPRDPRYIGDKK